MMDNNLRGIWERVRRNRQKMQSGAVGLDGLDQSDRVLWLGWRDERDQGRRDAASEKLAAFIESVKRYSEERRKRWVECLCRDIIDSPGSLEEADELTRRWIRQPLLVAIVLPELARGYQAGERGFARWIASLQSLINRGGPQAFNALGTDDINFNPQQYLREAVRVDPSDDVARSRLIWHVKLGIAYCMHELPRGLLWSPEDLQEAVDQ